MNTHQFVKIIGKNRGSFPYHLGLNTLAENGETFDARPHCVSGGLYFTDIRHVFDYLDYGDQLCKVSIPEDAQVVQVDEKWKADRIFIESIRPLWTLECIQCLVAQGADIHATNVCRAAENGHLDIVKYLVKQGVDIHADDDAAMRWAAARGHLDLVKYSVEQGADIHTYDDAALRWAAHYGHLDVVKYLVEQGTDIHVNNVLWAVRNGHLDVIKYLVEQGADIHAQDDRALRLAAAKGHLDVVKYSVEQGAYIHANNDYVLRWAAAKGRLDVVNYLRTQI